MRLPFPQQPQKPSHSYYIILFSARVNIQEPCSYYSDYVTLCTAGPHSDLCISYAAFCFPWSFELPFFSAWS